MDLLVIVATQEEAELLNKALTPGSYAVSVGGALTARRFDRLLNLVITDDMYDSRLQQEMYRDWYRTAVLTCLRPGASDG